MAGGLDGKAAFVTGAAPESARRLPLALANAGALPRVTGRRREKLDDLARTVEQAGGKAAAIASAMVASDLAAVIGFGGELAGAGPSVSELLIRPTIDTAAV